MAMAMDDPESLQARDERGFRTRIFLFELPEQEARKNATIDTVLSDADVEYLRGQSEAWRNRKTWVVYCGRIMGIFRTLFAAEAQVNGFDGARHQSYLTLGDAQRAWDLARATRYLGPPELWGEEPADDVVQRRSPTASTTFSSSNTITSWMSSSIDVSSGLPRTLSSRIQYQRHPRSPPPYQPHPMPAPSNYSSSLRLASPPPYHLYLPPVSSSHSSLAPALSNHPDSSLALFLSLSPALSNDPHSRTMDPQPLPLPLPSLTPPPAINSPVLHTSNYLASSLTSGKIWYVVLMGAQPGVYLGRPAAIRAMGTQGRRMAKKMDNEKDAAAEYMAQLRGGNVVQYYPRSQ